MRERNRHGALFRPFLAAVLLLSLLALPVRGTGAEEETYIVQYKAACSSRTDSGPPFREVSRGELDRLLAEDVLEWYEPNGTAVLIDPLPADGVSLQGVLSPWYADEMWHLDMIGAETAYELDAAGQGVRVAVIDSGVNLHPDLEGCLAEGWNYLKDNDSTGDSNGHGTGVCGLIAGGGEDGMVGTAPRATLIPLKCFEGTTTKTIYVCDAIWDAVDRFHCDVINLSVGMISDSLALREAVTHAMENGVIVVAAVGNGGTRTKHYPAFYDDVIGVAEVDSSGLVYKNSNHNESVLLTAPGAQVRSLSYLGGYDTFTGCSFATPLVTGTVADLLSMEPDLTRQEISAILTETAMDRGKPGWDEYYGWGILNLRGCVQSLASGFRLLPVETETGAPQISALNHTEKETVCRILSAAYDGDGRQTGVSVQTLRLPPGGREVLELPPETDRVFLCDGDLRPLTSALEIPQK